MREIYLDNAATTPCDGQVLKAMEPYWLKTYGNPSSFNDAGRKARKAIEESRKKIALILGAKSREIIFTSSATEANNLAVLGTVKASKKNIRGSHVITTKIEHHSVLEPIKKLEKEGIKISRLRVNKEGLVDLNKLKKAISSKTVLISVIYANNETGSVQPIKKIAKIIKEFRNSGLEIRDSPYPYLHIDAAQAAGHLDINVNNLGVDLMTVSSHKIYGPKGIAALYLRSGAGIEPLFYGGGQERNLRSSTEPVPLIAGFAEALKLSNESKEKNNKTEEELRNHFADGLKKSFPGIKINGPGESKNRVPHIINATFPEIENEQMLLQLDKCGIRASAGSACSSYGIEPSHVLTAIGLSKKEVRSSIRFSLGRETSKNDLDYVLKILPKVVKKVEKLYPQNLKKYYYGRAD